MATTPNFTKTPRNSSVSISTANTNRDGTGTVGTVFTANASFGSRVERIVIKAGGTTTAGMVRLFVHNGSAFFFYEEVAVPAITVSATVQAFIGVITYGASSRSSTAGSASTVITIPGPGLLLPAGYSLRASTHNAETFIVTAEGGDFDI